MEVLFKEGDRVLLPATTPESPWFDGCEWVAQRATVLSVDLENDVMMVEIDRADRERGDRDGLSEFSISTVQPTLLVDYVDLATVRIGR